MWQGAYSKANEAYRQAVDRNPRSPYLWMSIGVLYFRNNQYRDCLDAFASSIRLNSDDALIWRNLGVLVGTLSYQGINRSVNSFLSMTFTTTNQLMQSIVTCVHRIVRLMTGILILTVDWLLAIDWRNSYPVNAKVSSHPCVQCE